VARLEAQRTIRQRLKNICSIHKKSLRGAGKAFPENLSPAQHELRNFILQLGVERREAVKALEDYIPLLADRVQRIEEGPGLDLQVEQAKASLESFQHKHEMASLFEGLIMEQLYPHRVSRRIRSLAIPVLAHP